MITTDPSITRNNSVDYGKIYRGPTEDGPPSAYFFTATSVFDVASAFDHQFNDEGDLPIAAFKFSTLTLAGNPTIITDNGGALNLALISVSNIVSATPGGTLTFAGIQKLLLATQNGSITLGPELDFTTLQALFLYARGTGSGVTLGSSFDVGDLNLGAEGSIQVNGSGFANAFHAFAGTDFTAGSGVITTGLIDITAQNDVNFNTAQFSSGDFSDISISLIATHAVNINVQSDPNIFASAGTVFVNGETINLTGSASDLRPTGIIRLDVTSPAIFTAGTGGIHGPLVAFSTTGELQLSSGADIDIYEADIPFVNNGRGIGGLINAVGFIHAVGNITSGDVTAGTDVNVGGDLFVSNVTAGTTITAGGLLTGFDTATAGGDIMANETAIPTIYSPTGVLRVGAGGIHPFVESSEDPMNPHNPPQDGANLQHTITIDSIVSPAGIDFNGNQFQGISGLSSGGILTINARTIRFDGEVGIGDSNFDGADFHAFNNETTPDSGGSGGKFTVNTTGDIFVGQIISATTGLNDPNSDIQYSGAGGLVSLDSSEGQISVSSRIQVSSNDPDPGQTPVPATRHSASGGHIDLHSGLTTGSAITLNPNSQLLSLLNAQAPGPGGEISLLTEGGDISSSGATLEADRGTITISNQGTRERAVLNGAANVPLIAIDGGAIISETLDILSAGDIEFGLQNPVTVRAVTISFSADGNIRGGDFDSTADGPIPAKNSSGDVSMAASGSILFNSFAAWRSAQGITDGLNLSLQAGTTLDVTHDLFLFVYPAGLSSGGNIDVHSATDTTIGGTLNAETFFAGDTGAGGNISVTPGGNLSAGNFSLDTFVGRDVTVQNGANITLNVGGNLAVTSSDGIFNAFVSNPGGHIVDGGNISVTVAHDFTAPGLNALIDNRHGGMIDAGGNMTFNIIGNLQIDSDAEFIVAEDPLTARPATGQRVGPPDRITVNANNITGGRLDAYVDDTLMFTFPASGIIGLARVHASGVIDISGALNVLGSVSADGAINAGTLSSTDVSSLTSVGAGGGGIQRFAASPGLFGNIPQSVTAPVVTSSGGINFDGASTGNGDPNGGTLTINTNSLYFNTSEADIAGPVSFNGGMSGGNGGTFNVNTTGDITVSNTIEATTGLVDQNASPAGNGGAVNLNSSGGTISVNSRIEVSSNDAAAPTPSPTPAPPRRRSAKGGNISLTSGKSAPAGSRAVAINVSSSGQLLALLAAAPTPRPGGKITILATGANSDVNVAGPIRADGGTIDIRNQGDAGHVNLVGSATSTNGFNNQLSADVIKAGAFGANGQLNIGRSTLSADTLIRLYAPGSNGELIFVANTTLSSGSRIDLAASKITINPGFVVTITGNAGPANIYTGNANYAPGPLSPGGTNPNNGTFGGNGANRPQSLNAAPGFDSPPSRPAGGKPGG